MQVLKLNRNTTYRLTPQGNLKVCNEEECFLINGNAWHKLMSVVSPYLNGTRQHSEICNMLPAKTQSAFNKLWLWLIGNGLAHELIVPDIPPQNFNSWADYLTALCQPDAPDMEVDFEKVTSSELCICGENIFVLSCVQQFAAMGVARIYLAESPFVASRIAGLHKEWMNQGSQTQIIWMDDLSQVNKKMTLIVQFDASGKSFLDLDFAQFERYYLVFINPEKGVLGPLGKAGKNTDLVQNMQNILSDTKPGLAQNTAGFRWSPFVYSLFLKHLSVDFIQRVALSDRRTASSHFLAFFPLSREVTLHKIEAL